MKLLVRRHRAPFAVVQRARILLLAHQHIGTEEIARQLGCSARNVRKWKSRFGASPCMETLEDRDRSGRPGRIPVAIRCKLVQLACERPDAQDPPAPFRDVWTYGSLADCLEEQTGHRISVSEVGRILRFEHLRPHRIRQWLKSSDPNFLAKAKRICNLYLRPPKDAVVVCVDEKPMQVLERKHPTHVDLRDGSVRYEYEYKRHGTQSLLAAFNVKTGRVFGRVVPHRTADALVSFMNELARRYPNKTVYVVWDNLNTHYDGKDARWTRFNERHGKRFRFVYTPTHASWMNQVEIWFSILHRRVLRCGDFAMPRAQADRVEAFIRHWNRHERSPFRWKWRTDKLNNRQRDAAEQAMIPAVMPRRPAEPHHAKRVENLLHQGGAAHLRARKFGSAVIVESGPSDDTAAKHFRLRRDTVHLWLLDIANHRGRWERTPFRANLHDLVQTVLDDFPWTLTPIHE